MPKTELIDLEARHELWNRGILHWKLRPCQFPIYDQFAKVKALNRKLGFWRICRRFGKTFDFMIFAAERCLSEENILIPYAAPTIKHLKTVTLPIWAEISRDAPKELAPRFNKQDGVFHFPKTGSKILLGAAENGHYEKFRGIRSKYGLIDEAGAIKDLRILVNDILMPTLMYGDGFLGVSGTPPPTPDHYYTELAAICEANGTLIRKTVWENDALSEKEILEFAETLGCEIDWDAFNSGATGEMSIISMSTAFKRELLAEIVIDEKRAVIPEMNDETEERIVVDWDPPEYRHNYIVGDLGFRDATAFIFGYYDFKNAMIVMEDELILHSPTSTEIGERVNEKKKQLWGDAPVYGCFADGDLIVLADMIHKHDLHFSPVRKDVLEAQVNEYRLDISQDRIRINPRCKTVISHTKYGIWDKNRRKFDRSSEHYHFDALAAAIYFVRHVSRDANPYPPNLGASEFTHYIPNTEDSQVNELKKIIGVTR